MRHWWLSKILSGTETREGAGAKLSKSGRQDDDEGRANELWEGHACLELYSGTSL